MAERIKVYLKCCCGAEIAIETDEYKRTWLDERLGKFSELHKDCPEKLTRKLTETFTGFKPGLYATNTTLFGNSTDNVPVSTSGPDFWTDPTGKKIPY